ncbi:hypothetical protein QFC20_003302 [Naganishia adeliensis]|uniref:Uncharacterized protein n=1 Tax=Naganishia adeliensis TaxID=92952 RepID=A0ACC2WFD3_9TREE|nr:hypothetical protein QFC20_003302 [Naganishia adeliensis]
MKALQGLSLLALLATQTLARSEQSVLRVDHASVETPRFFPSEIKARTEHAAYELWRIHHPSSINTEEEALFRAAGVEDMTRYISQMADLLDLDIWHASASHVDILLPSLEIRERFLSTLPPRYGALVEVVIGDFPALYGGQEVPGAVQEVQEESDDEETDKGDESDKDEDKEDTLDSFMPKHRKPHKKPTRRRPAPSPSPAPPHIPPPPPPFSNRTTPDIYNTTDLESNFHDSYHSLSVIYDFMDELAVTYTGAVDVVVLGMSAEGREIRGVKIRKAKEEEKVVVQETGRRVRGKGRKSKVLDEDKIKEIYIQGGQHAREWVSPATVLYFAHHLLVSAFIENNTHALDLVDRYEFTLVPTINPDGYVYSQEHSRLWRKNRQDLDYGNCRGIDMNSNWGYQWSPAALFSNPCSESYPGAHAFEAVETQVVADYLKSSPNNVRAFVDVHSYGQLFMFPYSYSCSDFPKDAETLMEAALGVSKAVKGIHGTTYQAGQACDLIYRMAGDAIDWSYASAGIEWSYSAELRDTGTYGFLLPGSLIRPSAEEITAGLVYLAQFINRLESPS